jgi:hypothetical protein
MERINFTSTKTDGTGATAERISYVFGTTSGGSNLKTSIEAAIDRAITLGVPMQRGTVATFFDVPRITLNQGTCGQVLAELVRLVPDTMVWFDYSTSPVTINVSRRGSATTRTLDAASDALQSIAINPIQELQVSQVRLPYVTRDVAGRTQFQEQASGTPATGKVQILTISGPEIDTFIPNDLLDSFQIQTVSASSSAGVKNMVLALDSQWIAAAKKYNINFSNYVFGGGSSIIGPGYQETLFTSRGISAPSTTKSVSTLPLTASRPDGTSVSTSGKYVLLTEDIPYWSNELPFAIEKVTLTGQIALRHVRDDGFNSSTIYPLPDWGNDISFLGAEIGFTSNLSFGDQIMIFKYNFTINGYLIDTSYPTLTTLYRPADYTFIEPPANLAANLKAAQDWLPYEGDIEIVEEDVGAVRYRGCKIDISNSLTDLAAMGALVASERLDIATGTTTITLGQPPRLDFRTFVDRVRKTPQDNFEYV